MDEICAIGLMSGTSMDGIDLAVLRTDGAGGVVRGPSHFVPYDPAFRRRIEAGLETAKAIVARDDRPGDLADLEREITRRHAEAVAAFRSRLTGRWANPTLIGFHGQTVLHRPRAGITVQLGDGELLARETGLPVVFDLRANDMAEGGQGAPLVPAYHAALARSLAAPLAGRFPIVLVNIGGISNVTFVPEHGDPLAFDTGPGNNLIDQWVSREAGIAFDAGGELASRGRASQAAVDRYLAKPFFAAPGPKSLDRGDFTLEEAEGLTLEDGARTLAALAAQAVMRAAELLPEPPKLWIICGGGRKNPHIVGDMKALARGADVVTAEDAGFDGDATEAEAWAYLAVRCLHGLPITFPTTTGCRVAVCGGRIAGSPTSGASIGQRGAA